MSEKAKMKILLIGGYPKGFAVPFSPYTHSGKLLREIVQELKLDAQYLDLWTSKFEEDAGSVDFETLIKIRDFHERGFKIFVLGRYAFNRLFYYKVMKNKIEYLPHPARHSKQLKEKLSMILSN